MKHYSFPYQQALHKRLLRTTLVPVVIIGLMVVLVLPPVFSGFMLLSLRHDSDALKDALTKRIADCRDALMALDDTPAVADYLQTGDMRISAFEAMYALRNTIAPDAYFELTDTSGAHWACDLPAAANYTVREDILLTGALVGQASFSTRLLFPRSDGDALMVLAVPLKHNETLIGYAALIFTRQNIETLLGSYKNGIVLTNNMNRVLFSGGVSEGLTSQRLEPVDGNGVLIHMGGSLYLKSTAALSDVPLKVHTLFSMDFMVLLALVSFAFITMMVALIYLTIRRVSYSVATGPLLAPFDKLFTALKQYGGGDSLARINIDERDSAAPYLAQFNAVLDEISTLLNRNRELERATNVAELKMLQSQFDPHFVFNMLDMIKYTIYDDQKQAVEMVMTLAKMLRYTLDTQKTQVPVNEDFDYLMGYLYLQKMRLGDMFTYAIECPEAVRDLRIPKLLLQPLVENSVRHAYTGEKPLHIEIALAMEEDMLIIRVTDDGKGMTHDQFEAMKACLCQSVCPPDHIGLYNTHWRLRLAYGEHAGLTLQSAPQTGTTVWLSLKTIQKEGGVC